MRALPVSCAGCGAEVDPLRAGHAAVLDGRFHYYCDLGCRVRPARREGGPRRPADEGRTPSPARPEVTDAAEGPGADREGHEGQARLDDEQARSEAEQAEGTDEPAGERGAEGGASDADGLLLFTACAAGALSVALTLIGPSAVVTGARAAVALVGSLALVGRSLTAPRDPAAGHPLLLLAAPVLAPVTAVAARLLRDPIGSEAASVAGVIVAVTALLLALRRRSLADIDAERRWITEALSLPGRRISRDDVTLVAAHELRPGEEIRVEAGEIVPADMTVRRGEAEVLPWLGATTRVTRREGDALVAGARLLSGELRGVAGYCGPDRAWARILLDPSRRVDVRASLCRVGKMIAEQGALGAAGLAALAVIANGGRALEVLVVALSAHAALATATVASVAGLHAARGALSAARRGIAYRSPEAWDGAARVTAAIFLARGTLLLGEPDVVEIEPAGRYEEAQVLAWVTGAEAGESHPVSVATRRAARRRGVSPDAVRSPHAVPGLGVKAITSTGEALLVGSRALMLEQRVSIALAESRVAELEGLGRTVLLVAVSGRLAGLLALQDGLRPGARASVQHLLDVEVEPVLLSGDARETCETIARALDIEHVRPEVLPNDRAGEVRRIAEGGARVAVIGRPDADAAALGAADVPIALGAAGRAPGEWAVSLASDDVRDASLAIAIAHRTRVETKTALVIAVAPGVVGALAVSFGFLPPVFAPLAGLVGGLVATLHARSTAGARREAPTTPWDLVLPAPPKLRGRS